MDNNSKIKLAIGLLVLAVIAFFTWKGITGSIDTKQAPPPPRNQFVDRVETNIKSLKDSESFDKSEYVYCIFEIDTYHNQNELGSNSNDNDRWRDILKKDAYSAYAPKFVKYAMSIFDGSIWNSSDLVFIRNEVAELKKSEYLDASSSVASEFTKINNILNRYNEIRKFISTCNGSKNVPSFRSLISKSKSYLAGNGLDSYVLKCSSIAASLRGIPKVLYNKHASYLTARVNSLAPGYASFRSYSDYNSSVYDQLNMELENFNNIYGISSSEFNSTKSQLKSIIDQELQNAYDYPYL
jgi:hypothetical protein